MKNVFAAVGIIISFFLALGALGIGDMKMVYSPDHKVVCEVVK